MTKKRTSQKEMNEFENSTIRTCRRPGVLALSNHANFLASNGFLELPEENQDEIDSICFEYIDNYFKSLNNDSNEINQIETPEFEDDA